MEKKCDNCVNDNIGCDVIKKMRSDISKLRRINWSSLLIGLLIGGFIALAIIVVWANFCSRTENNNTPVNVQLKVKEIKDLAKTDKDAVDKVLHTTAEKAFYQGRKDAQNEFDKNFTTLLTILTIFGIAWPVIMTLVQQKLNDEKLRELEFLKEQVLKTQKENETVICLVKEQGQKMYTIHAESLYIRVLDAHGDLFSSKSQNHLGVMPYIINTKRDAEHITAIGMDLLQVISYYFDAFSYSDNKSNSIRDKEKQLTSIMTYVDNLIFNYKKYWAKYKCCQDFIDFISDKIDELENWKHTHELVQELIKKLQKNRNDLKTEVQENKEKPSC